LTYSFRPRCVPGGRVSF